MLDRLETELIQHILDIADQDWSSGPYHEAPVPQPTKSCSLVCRRLRQVAQPMLWRVIALDKKGEFEAVNREVAAGGLGRHVRALEANGNAVKASELRTLVESLPGLAEVHLRDFRDSEAGKSNAMDELLPHLQYLRHISLSRSDFNNIKTPFLFNNLSSLFLSYVKTTESFLSKLLQPHYLPELRSLAFDKPCRNLENDTFFPSFSGALLYQLDILQLSLRNLHLAKLEVIQHPTTLFSGTVYDLRQYLFEGTRAETIKILHVHPGGLHEALLGSDIAVVRWMRHYTCDTLGELVVFLPSSGITTLLLPIPLQHSALTDERDQLLATCRMKGVEVLWEDASSTDEEEEVFREEFRRWVVKKKRAQGKRAG